MISFNIDKMPDIVLLGYSICKQNWILSKRSLDYHELIYVYEGKVTFYIEGVSYELSVGDCLLLPKNLIHSGTNKNNAICKFYYVCFKPQVDEITIDKKSVYKQVLENKAKITDSKTENYFFILPTNNSLKIYLQLLTNSSDYENEILSIFEKALYERNYLSLNSLNMIKLYICQILIILTRINLKNLSINTLVSTDGLISRHVQEAQFYIHEHFKENISLNDLCNYLQITPQYLILQFKRSLGITPLKYINNYKISRAKKLLRTTHFTINEISYQLGFDNPYYFSRLFKKNEGLSPSSYRNIQNSKSNE